MSYHRASRSIGGRICGRGTRARLCVRGRYDLGDDLPSGISPSIAGDPAVALLAQVNRFAGAAAGSHQFVTAPYPLATGKVSGAAATTALMILQSALTTSEIALSDPGTVATLNAISAAFKDPPTYVMTNLRSVTTQLALYGDSVGLPSASVGITGASMPSTTTMVAIGGVVLLAYLAFGRSQKAAR